MPVSLLPLGNEYVVRDQVYNIKTEYRVTVGQQDYTKVTVNYLKNSVDTQYVYSVVYSDQNYNTLLTDVLRFVAELNS